MTIPASLRKRKETKQFMDGSWVTADLRLRKKMAEIEDAVAELMREQSDSTDHCVKSGDWSPWFAYEDRIRKMTKAKDDMARTLDDRLSFGMMLASLNI